MTTPRARTRVLALLALCLLAPHALAQDIERWFVVRLNGEHNGWLLLAERTEGDRITTIAELSLKLSRDQTTIEVSTLGEFVETQRGEPISMRTVSRFGPVPTETVARFRDDGVEVTTKAPRGDHTQTQPRPEGAWLTPAAARQFVRQRLAAGAAEIAVRSLEPTLGLEPVATTRTDIRRVPLTVNGRQIEAYRTTATSSQMPEIASTEYLDEQGVPVKFDMDLMGMRLDFEWAERETATRTLAAPEVMVSTLIAPDRPIDRPREATRVTLVLAATKGDLPDLPATGAQRVERLDAGRARVTIDTARPAPAAAGDAADRAYLGRSTLIDPQDQAVRDLLVKALGAGGGDRAERARALTRFVARYISTKDLDAGLASASDTARSRAGDCTEHAVLLAALLRAEGIPARVASGLVYVEFIAGKRDVFGYHMWTQALLDVDGAPTWIDLDAAVPGPASGSPATDATHIALSTTALADGDGPRAMGVVASLMGRLRIEVERVE